MSLHERYADLRDHFAILAIHAPDLADFEALAPRLQRLSENLWEGRDLPFPIVLDGSGETVKAYGVLGYPAQALIDPNGKLVRGGGEAMLERELIKLREGS